MGKIIDCNKVNPQSGCDHVVRGETEEELMENAKVHAVSHGFTDVTPELVAHIKANIREETTEDSSRSA
jgi:predicted small metal-binding protein